MRQSGLLGCSSITTIYKVYLSNILGLFIQHSLQMTCYYKYQGNQTSHEVRKLGKKAHYQDCHIIVLGYSFLFIFTKIFLCFVIVRTCYVPSVCKYFQNVYTHFLKQILILQYDICSTVSRLDENGFTYVPNTCYIPSATPSP